MIIGNRYFDTRNNTYIMGILNVTPDSFSDGGKYNTLDAALFHVEEMIADGADIIDIGGESTRPGYTMISEEEEIARTAPMIAAIKERFDVPLSIDTYKSKVAAAAVEAGVDMINDAWGLKYDENMAKVICDSGKACCLMHNREKAEYTDFFSELQSDLQGILKTAKQAGIASQKVMIDPGIGFGKTYPQNLEVICRLRELQQWGYPVMLGASRKSVIGLTLDLPVDERVEGTLVTTVFAAENSCAFVRVHDVKENARAIRMIEAILNYETAKLVK